MRLIDADKLKQELKVNGLGYQYYMLDNAPTVEAIPIEWIKGWYKRVLSKSGFMGDEMVSIDDLLSDWEKENE